MVYQKVVTLHFGIVLAAHLTTTTEQHPYIIFCTCPMHHSDSQTWQ